jgi:hypothetical protein
MENLLKHDIDVPSRLRSIRKLMLITFDEQLIQDSKVQLLQSERWVGYNGTDTARESVYKDDVSQDDGKI